MTESIHRDVALIARFRPPSSGHPISWERGIHEQLGALAVDCSGAGGGATGSPPGSWYRPNSWST